MAHLLLGSFTIGLRAAYEGAMIFFFEFEGEA